jgi:hypothetical protein
MGQNKPKKINFNQLESVWKTCHSNNQGQDNPDYPTKPTTQIIRSN